jgi:hypothetical protein
MVISSSVAVPDDSAVVSTDRGWQDQGQMTVILSNAMGRFAVPPAEAPRGSPGEAGCRVHPPMQTNIVIPSRIANKVSGCVSRNL